MNEPATCWFLIHHLYTVQIETWCYHQGEEHYQEYSLKRISILDCVLIK